MNEIYIFNAARLAVKSMMTVIITIPIDADTQTRIDGAMSLFQSLVNAVSVGVDTEGMKPEDAMTILRSSGEIGTKDALRATSGKYAMKGCMFMLGLMCASAGRLLAQKRILTPPALALTASSFVEGICSRELYTLAKGTTAGERAYVAYGFEGIRGEAEHGFRNTLRTLVILRHDGALTALRETAKVLDDTSITDKGGIGELMRVQGTGEPAGRGSMTVLACAVCIDELCRMRLTRSGYDE